MDNMTRGDQFQRAQDFKDAVKPLLKYLNNNHDHETTVIVTRTSAEIMQSELFHETKEFLKD